MHSETSQRGAATRIRRRALASAPCGGIDEGREEEGIEDLEPGRTTNIRKEFGSVIVIDPGRVVKLCLIVDNHKLPVAWRLWPEVETFHEERFRHAREQYHTPATFSIPKAFLTQAKR